MLAEIFMLWLEARRQPERTTTPSTSPFVPFTRGGAETLKGVKSEHR